MTVIVWEMMNVVVISMKNIIKKVHINVIQIQNVKVPESVLMMATVMETLTALDFFFILLYLS